MPKRDTKTDDRGIDVDHVPFLLFGKFKSRLDKRC